MFKKRSGPPSAIDGGEVIQSEAMNWEISRQESLESSEHRAWWVARIAVILAAMSWVVLIILSPFYKVVPLVFQVDKATGEAMQIEVGTKTVTLNEAQQKHWAKRYVETRERYIWNLLQMDYDMVMAMSDEKVGKDYRAQYEGENALDKRLGEWTSMRVSIQSVTLPPGEDGHAIVRFTRATQSGNAVKGKDDPFIAVLSFVFEPPKLFTKEKAVIDNPFGFKVNGYVVNSEVAGIAPAH